MKRVISVLTLGLVIVFANNGVLHSHCEIPCGIYGDTTRISLLYENIATVEKSMQQIEALSKADPVNVNQIVRWVSNKEKHCDEIQHIVTQYFMTQRVKIPENGASDKKYVGLLTTLHGMLVHAMKAKQTTDEAHIKSLRDGVKKLSELYFNEADLQHIKAHHPEAR